MQGLLAKLPAPTAAGLSIGDRRIVLSRVALLGSRMAAHPRRPRTIT